jgi:His/Glu/Gln/Arg/opine family amino acid ABC transporter permease subunit
LTHINFPQAFKELMPSLIHAIWIVASIALCAFLVALILGMLIALGRLSSNKMLSKSLLVFVEIIRGTPLLVQLLYAYYVLPEIISWIVGYWIPGYHMNFSAFAASVAGLGINYACYLSEVFRSSIQAIDKGQMEASLALGYTSRQGMWRIVIPQSLRIALPPLGNYFSAMIKDTSLCAFITVGEIILTTQAYASQTFLTIEAYTIAALFYLVISLPLSQCVHLLERRLRRHVA